MNTMVMNGAIRTDEFIQDDDNGLMNGTNMVVPMNGTNMVVPMNGTNMVLPMNGTNNVIPMQGAYGEYYVSPLAVMDEDDVPMQGVPSDFTPEEIELYRTMYLVGDPDAMQGLFKNVKNKIKQAIAGNKDAKNVRRERKAEKKAIRMERRRTGNTFLDKVGGALKNLTGAAEIADNAMEQFDEMGVDYDPEVIEQRAAIMTEDGMTPAMMQMQTRSADAGGGSDLPATGGGSGGGIAAWWSARSQNEKILIGVGGAAIVVGGIWYFTRKRKKGGRR